MTLLIFWIKIAIKRIFDLSKPYFLITICALISIGSFIYAFINGYISIILDIKQIYIITSLIIFLSLIYSLKNYYLMPQFVRYSKSSFQNKIICIWFFFNKALMNNIFLILFNTIAYYSIIKYPNNIIHIFILLGITILSIILSFVLMYIKYKYQNKNNSYLIIKRIKINPIIKSVLNDYLSSDFLISFILSIVFFIIFIISIIKDTNTIYELRDNSNFFIILTLIFSIGFTSIIGSIPHINWKFHAIISINNFTYHFKRTFFVLIGFFGLLILIYTIFGSLISITLTLKYLYCLFIILFSIVNISLTITNMLMKIFMITIYIVLTIWISTLPFYFLSILLIPLILTLIKAKNEYVEWSIL